MIKSAVTISLVPEARGGPFVFWDDLEEGCRKAAALGFDAVEVFAPDAKSLEASKLHRLLEDYGLKFAAAGTGAGWVKHKLSLTSQDFAGQKEARVFIRSIVRAAGALGAPAIVGSMQGRWGDAGTRDDAVLALEDAFNELEDEAAEYGVPLLYEPLNRYETNLFNSVADAAGLVRALQLSNTKVLADLFHMNLEEADMASSIRAAGNLIGHVHFADSNRRPAGMGHTDFAPVIAALRDIGYEGYVSAECLPYPDPDMAARQTIESFRKLFK